MQCPLFLLALVWIALVGRAYPAVSDGADKPKIDLREHPTGGKTPVEVSAGLYLTNLVSIDESRELFEVTGYLFGKWRDPRLQLPPGSGNEGVTRKFTTEQIWIPEVQGENSIFHKNNSYTLEADANGVVSYTEHFDGIFSTAFSLRKFPFDRQVLRMEYLPFFYANKEFRFACEPLPVMGLSDGRYTELGAWQIKGLRYSMQKVSNMKGGESTRAAFEITVARRSGFYVWKVFLPLLLMTLIPMVAFWVDVDEFDWMLKIPMTMLLATVAFEFVVSRDLPKIGYMTLLDAIFLASYVLFSICIAEILIVFLLQRSGKSPQAERLHAVVRWAYPASYFAVLALLAAHFLA